MLPVPHLFPGGSTGRGATLRAVRTVITIVSFASLGVVGCDGSSSSQQANSSPTASAAASPTPTPPGDGCRREQFVVGDTNGLGVNLRKTPGGEVLTAYVEGTKLTVCGEKVVDGQQWYRVTVEDGAEGWILDTYVVPASPVPMPSG